MVPTTHPRSRVVRQRIRLLLLTLTTCLCASTVGFAQNAEDDYTRARGLYKSRRYEQAEKAFAKFLTDHSDHPRAAVATLYHGLTLTNLSRYSEARDRFDKFIRENPDNANLPDAQYRSGECSYYLKEYELAERKLRAFRTENPGHALVNWAYLFEAESQLSQKNWEQAQKTFQTLLDRKPEQQTTRDAEYGLARSLEGQAKVSEAFNFYRRLVSANDPVVTPRALSRMGTLYFKANDLKSAVRAYSMIHDRYSASSLSTPARLNTGMAYYRLRDYDNAILWLERAGREKANRPRANILHAISLQRQQKFQIADQILQTAFAEFSETKSAPELLYYRADGLRLSGRATDAVPIFEQISADWPESPFADDALFFAADSAVQAKDYPKAGTLLDRLERDFATHPYKDSAHMLKGRVLAAGNNPADLRAALVEFKLALTAARNDRTKLLSGYYTARTHQRLREHKEALDSAQPVVDEVVGGQHADLAGILVLAAVSHLAGDELDEAARRATQYIDGFPNGSRRADAFEARAIVRARQANRADAEADLKALTDMNLNAERLANAVRRVAEVAWESKNFAWSAELFEQLTADKTSALRPAGLSGLGWSYFEQANFPRAAEAFGQLVEDHPQAPMVAEATFMLGEAHRRAKNLTDALAAYRKAFDEYLPTIPAERGAEFKTPERFAFDAGRQVARILEAASKADEADDVYKRLTQAFPHAEKMDEILERWAFMHLDAENFDRSDDLFRRLVDEQPQSPLVPNARLALAESDMIANRLQEAETAFLDLKSDPAASETVRASALYNLITISDRKEVDENIRKYVREYLDTFPGGEFTNHVKLFQAETLVRSGETENARDLLTEVKAAVTVPGTKAEPWHPRVWVVLAETHRRDKQYASARLIGDEMLARAAWSDYFHQMYEVLGRTYLQEAPPDFEKAREYFQKVIVDKVGSRTPTAAKCHLYIGDSWRHQLKHDKALEAYQKVYFNFAGLPDLRAAGLFQAASCEESLDQPQDALKSYRDLVAEFPTSTHVAEAKKRIQALENASGMP